MPVELSSTGILRLSKKSETVKISQQIVDVWQDRSNYKSHIFQMF